MMYSKTCLKRPLSKRPKMGFQDQLSLNAGQKYAILSTCIKLPHGFKTFVLSIFEWPLKTGFTVLSQVFNKIMTKDKQCLCVQDKKKMSHQYFSHIVQSLQL